MIMPKQIRWGIIGLGSIAHTFAADLKLVPNAVLQGVASRSLSKATEFQAEFNAKEAFGNYEDLAKNSAIDVVYIATPHVFHFENTKLCLKNGKSVLCEKPMGINAKQVKELCNIAKENKVFLMEAMWTAFLPNYNRLKNLVASKELGNITSFNADFGFKAPNDPSGRLLNKSLGGGSMLDIGIYPVFACLELLGTPASISAEAKIGSTGVDENCKMLFSYTSLKAELYCTIIKNTPTKIEIEFEKGKAVLGPGFYAPSNLTVTNALGDNKVYEKHTEGSGYQFEAIHVQGMLLQQKLESNVMSHAKSILIAECLDRVLEEIGLKYT